MKKTYRLMCSAVLLGGMLAGCSSSGESAKPAGETKQADASVNKAEKVKLTFWRNSGNDTENAAYEKLVAAFMEKHPNISIDMVPIPYSDYDTKLRVSIASGSPPDIMALDAPTLASYADAGALKPLTSYFKADGNMDDIPKSTLATYTYQNEIYMAPLTESSIALFYNKKLFQANGIPLPSKNPDEPWTWEQVLDAAKKLNDPAKGVFGIDPAQGFGNAGATAYFKYPIVWQFGGEIMSPDGKTAKGYLDSAATKKAIQFFSELYNKEQVSALEYPPEPFPNGKLAITIDGSWSLANLKEKYPSFKLGEDYDIAPLPKGTKQAVANGSWALGISAKSGHPDEAWTFINFVTGAEGQKIYCEMTKDIPSRYSAAKQFPELNEYPKNIFVVQNQKYGRPRPITPIFPQMADAVNKMFEDVTIGKRNIDTAVAEAVTAIDKAYADAEAQKKK
ncbi:ABC transporter substrate-binding protein [Paenibacillus chartarius]|uniref:ABC transporter substrate-binding protein n=1 Tax=Paenibacillus chartarius TaxID=747481 RepID=A0ABV6DVQ3_9BACL